jgi:hypothetical protein
VYADPGAFSALPYSEVTRLQQMLLDDRIGFLRDPENGTPQAIAAFASLHIAMSFTSLVAGPPARPGPPSEDRAVGLAPWSRASRRSTWAGTTSSTTSPASRSARCHWPWRAC